MDMNKTGWIDNIAAAAYWAELSWAAQTVLYSTTYTNN